MTQGLGSSQGKTDKSTDQSKIMLSQPTSPNPPPPQFTITKGVDVHTVSVMVQPLNKCWWLSLCSKINVSPFTHHPFQTFLPCRHYYSSHSLWCTPRKLQWDLRGVELWNMLENFFRNYWIQRQVEHMTQPVIYMFICICVVVHCYHYCVRTVKSRVRVKTSFRRQCFTFVRGLLFWCEWVECISLLLVLASWLFWKNHS